MNRKFIDHSDRQIKSFADLLYTSAAQYPDKACYKYLLKRTEHQVTFSQFAHIVDSLGCALDLLGLAGDIPPLSVKSVMNGSVLTLPL